MCTRSTGAFDGVFAGCSWFLCCVLLQRRWRRRRERERKKRPFCVDIMTLANAHHVIIVIIYSASPIHSGRCVSRTHQTHRERQKKNTQTQVANRKRKKWKTATMNRKKMSLVNNRAEWCKCSARCVCTTLNTTMTRKLIQNQQRFCEREKKTAHMMSEEIKSLLA